MSSESVDIAYVDQLRDDLNPDATVWEEISGGEETLSVGNREMNSRAYCARFNFKGSEQQQKVGILSGGERNRVHLAKLLRRGGNLLLLDEPTNDLDVGTLRSLEEGLMNFGGCAVVISHDRWFLDRVATHILPLKVMKSSGSKAIMKRLKITCVNKKASTGNPPASVIAPYPLKS